MTYSGYSVSPRPLSVFSEHSTTAWKLILAWPVRGWRRLPWDAVFGSAARSCLCWSLPHLCLSSCQCEMTLLCWDFLSLAQRPLSSLPTLAMSPYAFTTLLVFGEGSIPSTITVTFLEPVSALSRLMFSVPARTGVISCYFLILSAFIYVPPNFIRYSIPRCW